MILLLDTSTPLCRLTLVDSEQTTDYEWQADRQLAKGLLSWLRDRLAEQDRTFADIDGIGVLRGPGSFTGLRIGLAVLNTLADGLHVPIVGTVGDDWRNEAVSRLQAGDNNQIVLPYYSTDANITTQRK
jgi:tRNA threonylcarbamoyladenosine biosynthesis protein TsaB